MTHGLFYDWAPHICRRLKQETRPRTTPPILLSPPPGQCSWIKKAFSRSSLHFFEFAISLCLKKQSYFEHLSCRCSSQCAFKCFLSAYKDTSSVREHADDNSIHSLKTFCIAGRSAVILGRASGSFWKEPSQSQHICSVWESGEASCSMPCVFVCIVFKSAIQ